MLFVIRDLRVLILASRYHVYLTDLVLKRVSASARVSAVVYSVA